MTTELKSAAAELQEKGWIEWNGGECPVHPETLIQYELRNNELGATCGERARDCDWSHNSPNLHKAAEIIAYRVIKEYEQSAEQTPVKTLRDEMAIAALAGLAWHDLDTKEDWTADYIADRAYCIADAMLEARKKGGEVMTTELHAAADEISMQWRTIDSAPMDGTKVLLGRFDPNCKEGKHGRMAVDFWHNTPRHSYEGWGQFNTRYWPATHWMPLPVPPTTPHKEKD